MHGYRKVNILDKRKKEVLYEHFKEYSFQPQINKRSQRLEQRRLDREREADDRGLVELDRLHLQPVQEVEDEEGLGDAGIRAHQMPVWTGGHERRQLAMPVAGRIMSKNEVRMLKQQQQ